MIKLNPFLYQLKAQSLQITFGKVVRIENWRSSSLKAAFWRCYCPLEKGGVVYCNGKKHELLPGMAYIIPALTDFASDVTQPFVKIFVHFNYDVPDLLFKSGIYPVTVDEEMMNEFQMFTQKEMDNVLHKLQLQLFQLISKGLCKIPENAITHRHHDPRIYQILSRMQSHLKDGIGNQLLAKMVHLTEPSMIRLFKDHLGVSPQKYLSSLRLKMACDLLVHSEQSIDEIADECGFYDRNHFSKAFRRQWTYPPATYRKIHEN